MQDNHIELQKSKKKVQEQVTTLQQLLDKKSDEIIHKDNNISEIEKTHLKKLKEEKDKLNNKIEIKDNKINELSQSFSDAKYKLDNLESIKVT